MIVKVTDWSCKGKHKMCKYKGIYQGYMSVSPAPPATHTHVLAPALPTPPCPYHSLYALSPTWRVGIVIIIATLNICCLLKCFVPDSTVSQSVSESDGKSPCQSDRHPVWQWPRITLCWQINKPTTVPGGDISACFTALRPEIAFYAPLSRQTIHFYVISLSSLVPIDSPFATPPPAPHSPGPFVIHYLHFLFRLSSTFAFLVKLMNFLLCFSGFTAHPSLSTFLSRSLYLSLSSISHFPFVVSFLNY